MSSIRVEVDPAKLRVLEDEAVDKLATAARASVTASAISLERELEILTRANIPGRAYRAWNRKLYLRGDRNEHSPAAIVYAKGKGRTRGMIEFWTRPGVNRPKSGRFLAIPLPAAGSRGVGKDLTPEEWKKATGRELHFVFLGRGRTNAALVAEVPNARRGQPRTVAIFSLIREQPHANAFSLGNAAERAAQRLGADFLDRAHRLVVG